MERLIGEGAVRTVKKPTQMKKRLLTTQSSVFLQKEDFEEMVEQAQADAKNDITALNMIGNDKCIDQQENYETGYDYKTSSHQTYNDSTTISSTSNIIYNTPDNKQPDITTYLLMNDCPMDGTYKIKNKFFRTDIQMDRFILLCNTYNFCKDHYIYKKRKNTKNDF